MADVELPQDLLSVLPTDPYEQLDIAQKITALAVSLRVSELEAENAKLRQNFSEKEGIIDDLQQYVSELEKSLQESTDQLSQAMVEQGKLKNENNILAATVKKLTRDVSKLETFKRTLMQSLQDDDEEKDESQGPLHSSSISTSTDSLNARTGMADFNSSTHVSSSQSPKELAATSSALPQDETPYDLEEVKPVSQKPSTVPSRLTPQLTPHDLEEVKSVSQKPSTVPSRLTPQLTPTRSPRRSATGSPLQLSAPGSPRSQSASDAPASMPSSESTSEHTTAPSSPPQPGSAPVRTPRVDGKDFFRQARNRLSYEQFSAFLSIIKELNAHRQTKEETLRKAEEIFGSENSHLYVAFNALLGRHLPT